MYDERTINVSTNDTLIGFEVTPDLIQLAINQISFAEYIAKYVHFSTPLGNFDQSLMILINDSNIVSFDTSIHGFKGRNNGQTFAVASYQGFSDTIYFDVTGCVGGTVNITSSSTSICQGDTLQLTASSGIQFEWSTGDTTQSILVTTGGEYSLISIDDNNCIASKSIDIIVTALPSITSSITNVNCYGNNTGTVTATVTSGTSPYLYSWSPSGGKFATASNLSSGITY
ncbi:MAG: SprB repeat-containing protein [Bacteroidetes bacterium]|nr:SprB repeat-containing protein [Bacteroidota bacterium]